MNDPTVPTNRMEVLGKVLVYRESRRPCPRHQTPCFAALWRKERSRGDVNLVWFCPDCWAWYPEEHFHYLNDAAWRGVKLTCPACGAHAVDHDCYPGCCDNHVCLACGKALDIRVELVSQGIVGPSVETNEVDGTGWLGDLRPCRCGAPRELVWRYARPAWRCPSCGGSNVEFESRIHPERFDDRSWRAPKAIIGCAQCDWYLEGEGPEVTCARCGAVNTVRAVRVRRRPISKPIRNFSGGMTIARGV